MGGGLKADGSAICAPPLPASGYLCYGQCSEWFYACANGFAILKSMAPGTRCFDNNAVHSSQCDSSTAAPITSTLDGTTTSTTSEPEPEPEPVTTLGGATTITTTSPVDLALTSFASIPGMAGSLLFLKMATAFLFCMRV